MSVVLSYSRKDREFADTVYQRLKSSGYDVWMDRRDIQIGSPWIGRYRTQSTQGATSLLSYLPVQ